MAWQCDLDWQAIATFSAVVGAVCVGVLQTRILKKQTEIQELALRSDLFDRRYRVFECTVKYLLETRQGGGDPTDETQRNFAIAMGEAQFLFHTKVYDGLNEIRAQWAQYHKVHDDMEHAFQTCSDYVEGNSQRRLDLSIWFENRLRTLPDLFDEMHLRGCGAKPLHGRGSIAGNCSPNGRS